MLVTEDQLRRKYGAFISMDGEPAVEMGVNDELTLAKLEKIKEAKKVLNDLLDSEEGQQAIIEALKDGIKISKELSESRRVTREAWTTPFTI